MKHYLLLLLCTIVLFGCLEDEKQDPRERYKYHVFLRAGGGSRAFYAGSTIGLGSCSIIGRRALKERSGKELAGGSWEIVCCWYTENSQCKEEHRYQDKNIPYEEWNKDPKNHIKPWRKYFFSKGGNS